MVKELIHGISQEAFQDEKPVIIGTGGFSRLFENSKLFDVIIPTLTLEGLYRAYQMNMK
jgi:type III pantothenate kinase